MNRVVVGPMVVGIATARPGLWPVDVVVSAACLLTLYLLVKGDDNGE